MLLDTIENYAVYEELTCRASTNAGERSLKLATSHSGGKSCSETCIAASLDSTAKCEISKKVEQISDSKEEEEADTARTLANAAVKTSESSMHALKELVDELLSMNKPLQTERRHAMSASRHAADLPPTEQAFPAKAIQKRLILHNNDSRVAI